MVGDGRAEGLGERGEQLRRHHGEAHVSEAVVDGVRSDVVGRQVGLHARAAITFASSPTVAEALCVSASCARQFEHHVANVSTSTGAPIRSASVNETPSTSTISIVCHAAKSIAEFAASVAHHGLGLPGDPLGDSRPAPRSRRLRLGAVTSLSTPLIAGVSPANQGGEVCNQVCNRGFLQFTQPDTNCLVDGLRDPRSRALSIPDKAASSILASPTQKTW